MLLANVEYFKNLDLVALTYLNSCLKSFKLPNSLVRMKDSKYNLSCVQSCNDGLN